MPRTRKREENTAVMPPPGAPQEVGDTTAANQDRERVAARAYELYLARGGSDGRALDEWLEAERELGRRSTGADEPEF
jgi:hypothetical protein